MKKLQFTIILLTIVVQVYAQQTEMPFIRNFMSSEFKAYQQNLCIAQDRRGVMYFGNYDGVLEFDGINWRLIKLSGVRSIAIDSAGNIFVGTSTDLGYLQTDKVGNLKFCSLKEKIPEKYRNFSVCRNIFIVGDQVVFQTDEGLFIYQNGQFNLILNENLSRRPPIVVNSQFYIHEKGKGLFYLQNDSLRFIEGSECLANLPLFGMLPYKNDDILMYTNTGFFIYAPDSVVKFFKPHGFKEVNDYLLKNDYRCATKLPNGDIAIGTTNDGILIFDTKGVIKKRYNKSNGLQDNTVWQLYVDKNQQLWAGLENGISLIQTNIPFKQYTSLNGLIGMPMSLSFFNNHLYVGTSQYIHIQNQQGNFETIKGTGGRNRQLFTAKGSLLSAYSDGIFEIKGKQAKLLKNTENITSIGFCRLKNHPEYLLIHSFSGLYLIEFKDKTWKFKHKLKGFSQIAYFCVEDKEANIWVLSAGGFCKLKINKAIDSVISFQQYTPKEGLPSNAVMPVLLNSGEVIFSTKDGIYRYLSTKDRFELNPDLAMLKGLVSFKQEKNGDILFDELQGNGNTERGVLKYKNGKYLPYKTPFHKFNSIRSTQSPSNFCSASDSSKFFGTSEGLLQYNPLQKVNFNLPFHTLIRKVFTKDSLRFGGKTQNLINFEKIEGKEIPFSQNNVIFQYAATFYENAEKNIYSYRLIGFDTTWSAWSSESKKDYNYLYEGDYVFEVKSMNQYKTIGSIASYSFSILPPFYRTWWAYSLYVILSILFILIILKIYTRSLVKQKEHLEEVVEVRTLEVTEKNEKLNLQNKEIITQSEEITSQRDTLSKQNAKIISSITYAKLIQKAVFPNQDIISMLLPQSFILFKPCDIVSGDFYFVKQVKNKTIIAVGDCTGHGIPGALMSMLGIAILNEITKKQDVTNSAYILNELRIQIKNSLQQTGRFGEQQDGMDIAFCSIDIETLEMSFAGAYNPCWVFRKEKIILENEELNLNNNSKLIIIEPNRMPIGVYRKEKPFTEQTFQLQTGDVIYLFSDGYHSQFGNVVNEKFKIGRFKELLTSISHLPLNEQKEILDQKFYEWKGDFAQTDDVLVMAVKF